EQAVGSRRAGKGGGPVVRHVGERPRQRARARGAVAGARIGGDGDAGGGREPIGKIAPQRRGAETLVQQHDRGRQIACAGKAIFKAFVAKREETRGGELRHLLSFRSS